MLKLYTIPVSLYCAKLRIVLRHKGLQWEEVAPPGGYGSDEYKSIVPAGNLPALDHDGLIIGDSEAIAEYLDEFFPEPAMLSGTADIRAKIRERSRFHDTRLEPSVRTLFAHIGKSKREDEFLAKQWLVLRERFVQAEPLLPQKVSELTLGDCGFPITCTWISELAAHFDLPDLLNLKMRDYLQQLNDFEAVSDEIIDYRPRLTDWLSKQ